MTAEHRAEFSAALPHADVVTPNWLEASLLYGEKDAATLMRRMLDDGAALAVLRLGEAGSLIGRRGEAQLLRVPAVPVPDVVDVTGAGNTYGGGFLVAWHASGDLARAGAYGAVAASFCIEGLGALRYTATRDGTRDERLDWVLARAAWE
jgi:sugar/nucleoside kinase (ribokinase family)